ncbi:hypothetical protein Sjap_000488 [Stephania japonica]|uniref:Uncharacterized protein n=1 Tax=Stephania japonica TaxID=461633 RepID=A0AAP0PQH2_9MAGN
MRQLLSAMELLPQEHCPVLSNYFDFYHSEDRKEMHFDNPYLRPTQEQYIKLFS